MTFSFPCLSILIALCFLRCSENNFLPAKFETEPDRYIEHNTIDKGFLVEYNERSDYISYTQIHRYHIDIDSGFLYRLDYNTQHPLLIDLYVTDRSDTTLMFDLASRFASGSLPLIVSARRTTLLLDMYIKSDFSNQQYSLSVIKDSLHNLYGSYPDTGSPDINDKSSCHFLNDSIAEDTIFFDYINRKYLYAIPLDSFELCAIRLRSSFLYGYKYAFADIVVAQNRDSILIDTTITSNASSLDFSWNYWQRNYDTLYLSLGIEYVPGNNYQRFGVFPAPPPKLQLFMSKHSFPPVKPDLFEGIDDNSEVLFEKETKYESSISEKPHHGYYILDPDSVYSLSVISPENNYPLSISITPEFHEYYSCFAVNSLTQFSFRPPADPDSDLTKFSIRIKNGSDLPVNYSLLLEPYRGFDTLGYDQYETDDIPDNSSLFQENQTQEHTLFPVNDRDIFKVQSPQNDTFYLYVDFVDRDSLPFSRTFTLEPLYRTKIEDLNIHTTHRDSGSVRIYQFTSKSDITAFLIASGRECMRYTVTLVR